LSIFQNWEEINWGIQSKWAWKIGRVILLFPNVPLLTVKNKANAVGWPLLFWGKAQWGRVFSHFFPKHQNCLFSIHFFPAFHFEWMCIYCT
jgi:hypothetical protein